MNKDCLFCKIVSKEIQTKIEYENDVVVAINDISPQAPTHILIFPKLHIPTINDLRNNEDIIIGAMFNAAKKIAKMRDFYREGYRTVINCNKDAGQTVFHIHLHLLAGRPLQWPPG
jgi:histidine triad (HIT) family protein